jgi:hypothetical protein
MFGWIPEWGSLPDWVEALGTIAAFFAAWKLLRRQLREFGAAEADRAAQQRVLEKQQVASEKQQVAIEAQVQLLAQQLETDREQLVVARRPLLVAPSATRLELVHRLKFKYGDTIDVEAAEAVVFVHDPGTTFRCGLAFRNLGAGPAFVTASGIQAGGVSAPVWSILSRSVVGPDELVWVTLSTESSRMGTDETTQFEKALRSGSCTIQLGYKDTAGVEYLRSMLHMTRADSGGWYPRQTAIYHGLDEEPFLMSGPQD